MIMFSPLRIRKFCDIHDYHILERYAFLWNRLNRDGKSIFCMEYQQDESRNRKLDVLFWDGYDGEVLMDRGELVVRSVEGSIEEIVERLKEINPELREVIKNSLSKEANELLEAAISS